MCTQGEYLPSGLKLEMVNHIYLHVCLPVAAKDGANNPAIALQVLPLVCGTSSEAIKEYRKGHQFCAAAI